MTISALNVHESPEFPHRAGNWRDEHDSDVRFQTGSRNKAVSRMRINMCNRLITLIYGGIAEISASHRKSGSRNTTVNINDRKVFDLLEQG